MGRIQDPRPQISYVSYIFHLISFDFQNFHKCPYVYRLMHDQSQCTSFRINPAERLGGWSPDVSLPTHTPPGRRFLHTHFIGIQHHRSRSETVAPRMIYRSPIGLTPLWSLPGPSIPNQPHVQCQQFCPMCSASNPNHPVPMSGAGCFPQSVGIRSRSGKRDLFFPGLAIPPLSGARMLHAPARLL